MKKGKKINPNIVEITISEADFLLETAKNIDNFLQPKLNNEENLPIGAIITSNICVGLSIEILLKSIMLLGRNQGAVQGHNLEKLYFELPENVQQFIKDKYNSLFTGKEKMIEVAHKFSKETPTPPLNTNRHNFHNFEYCLEELSNLFTHSRYYYEEIGNDWVIISYFFEAGRSLAIAVKEALLAFRSGDFKGKI